MENDFIAKYYSDHVNELRTFFMVRLADHALSEDMAQDVFVKILGYGQMITEQTLPSLVYTVARRLLTDHYRHLMAVRRQQSLLSSEIFDGNSPLAIYEANELAATLEDGIAHLSEPCREVYRLHVYDGLKVSRIAETMQLNYKVAERRLGIARRAVRDYVRRVV